jgi:hypothetical protein
MNASSRAELLDLYPLSSTVIVQMETCRSISTCRCLLVFNEQDSKRSNEHAVTERQFSCICTVDDSHRAIPCLIDDRINQRQLQLRDNNTNVSLLFVLLRHPIDRHIPISVENDFMLTRYENIHDKTQHVHHATIVDHRRRSSYEIQAHISLFNSRFLYNRSFVVGHYQINN